MSSFSLERIHCLFTWISLFQFVFQIPYPRCLNQFKNKNKKTPECADNEEDLPPSGFAPYGSQHSEDLHFLFWIEFLQIFRDPWVSSYPPNSINFHWLKIIGLIYIYNVAITYALSPLLSFANMALNWKKKCNQAYLFWEEFCQMSTILAMIFKFTGESQKRCQYWAKYII